MKLYVRQLAMPLNEDTLVQQTTADYLEQELKWESVYAYNTETFGPRGTWVQCLVHLLDPLHDLLSGSQGLAPELRQLMPFHFAQRSATL